MIPAFKPEELLYYRTDPLFIQPDGTIDAVHIDFRFPDLSVNRSAFSEPWYVLYPRSDWGGMAVVKCSHRDVPSSVQGEGSGAPVHTVKTEHDPLEDNYGHCEIRIYKGPKRLVRPNQLKDGPKAKLRLAFSKLMTRAWNGSFPPQGWVDPFLPKDS